MANSNNSSTANLPASYTIVFQVDLTSPTFPAPGPNGDQTEAVMAATRSTWIPQGFEQGGQSRVVKHGDQFTAYDDYAYYLKNNYVRSASNPNGILTIVTETP